MLPDRAPAGYEMRGVWSTRRPLQLGRTAAPRPKPDAHERPLRGRLLPATEGTDCDSLAAIWQLNLRRPCDLMLPKDCPCWRKLVRIVQAPYCYVDATGLLIALPCKRGAASAAKCPNNSGRGIKGLGVPNSYRELLGSYQEPPNRLGSSRAPTIGAMAHYRLLRRPRYGIPDFTAKATSKCFGICHGTPCKKGFLITLSDKSVL
jgi:hypothetical protein